MITLQMIVLPFLITLFLLLIIKFLPMNAPDKEKLSPYECGFEPSGSARLPFSMKFFLVAILFILFDLEIILLFPLAWALNSQSHFNSITLASVFVVILTLGLIYEWLKGGLEWTE
uniref:NADH dehydrogenase subunit 3 n=1 Tax=Myxine fernholmi TaxID=1932030 RepID=UPI001EE14A5F|nr:NADH dehydrogenase subunit 3 [Myxine fernholmi]UKB88182.1 NADH dehydrogenase subunit 3 [Myxine fernholmi]